MNNQMIPLTVANTLDQSVKQRIEARGQQTVKQAVQEAKMAPQGQFDVFDGLGKVVSNQPVDQFRDKTIYIGVQEVAGGALQFDDDWEDEGIDLDDIDQPIRKSVTLIGIDGYRQEIEPQGDETLIEAAERAGFYFRDGTAIEVRDTEDGIVSNRRARDMVGRAFHVNPRFIPGAAGGIPLNRLNELRVEFPSIQSVRQHTDSTHTDMIILQFPSGEKTSSGFWRLAVHCPDASSGLPHSYVLNRGQIVSGPGVSIFNGGMPTSGYGAGASNTLPGTNKPAHWVCHGQILNVLNHLGNDPVKRMGAYINHIQNLLNA